MQIIGLIFHLSGSCWLRNVPKGLKEWGTTLSRAAVAYDMLL